ncbi:DUF4031 domain-containing protein [Xylanimonas allomyrinae]|uniref:DUF4031 domain-containing protein n=1 Tax=Xylanimonas allomyrinae TaxID=2509459 RepID=UPI002691E21A
MILLDPPTWPAHGTVWSHLVSDTSLHELRAFARAAGLPDRSFDLDHYDTPADRHADLLAAGATAVGGRTLARRLGASGLRVAGHERAGARRDALRARWERLWSPLAEPARWPTGSPPAPASGPASAVLDAGGELVRRWSEPHRVYHGRLHLAAALDALDALLVTTPLTAAETRTVRLALWFHDAVHDGVAGRDEERSGALASDVLAPPSARGCCRPRRTTTSPGSCGSRRPTTRPRATASVRS